MSLGARPQIIRLWHGALRRLLPAAIVPSRPRHPIASKQPRRERPPAHAPREVGLADAALDQEGNVIAVRKGASGKPKLVVSAHLDTVFPEGTDVTVKERDGTTLAPGIGDDARGLAALLSLIQALNRSDIKTVGDVVFVGTVGEEELGNLRGRASPLPGSPRH